MSDPDPDYFAIFGLDRSFDIDESALSVAEAKARRMADAPTIETARRVLADPESRALHLVGLMEGEHERIVARGQPGMWAADREAVDVLRSRWTEASAGRSAEPPATVRAAIDAQRDATLKRISALFAALRRHDNPVVQRDRRREIHMRLNTLHALRGIGAGA